MFDRLVEALNRPRYMETAADRAVIALFMIACIVAFLAVAFAWECWKEWRGR